jgi:hypothetical protein
MNQGFWINYDKGKIFDIQEHETWLRTGNNADKLGVPSSVQKMFGKFKPVRDRNKFLLFVMKHAPVMRARGHGVYSTFEYNSSSKSSPMDAIWDWGKRYAGDYTGMNIINFATNENTYVLWKQFKELMGSGGYDAIMRAASVKMRMKRSIASAILKLSRQLLDG